MIKCGLGRTFDAVRRGIRDLRWDSAGNSGVLSGVPGCDHDYDDRNLYLNGDEQIKHIGQIVYAKSDTCPSRIHVSCKD